MPVHASAPAVNGKTVDYAVSQLPGFQLPQNSVRIRTQSNAFDSCAQISGHSRGVMVASLLSMASLTSFSMDASERLRGCVVEVQESQEEVLDVKEPDWASMKHY